MREIKFRIWDEHCKQMANAQDLSVTFDRGQITHFWHRASDYEQRGNAEHPLDQSRYKVMQFTGELDKKHIEIYEGDILRVNGDGGDRKIEVKFQDGGFIVDDNFDDYSMTTIAWAKDIWMDGEGATVEVIGNIYENPELFKAATRG